MIDRSKILLILLLSSSLVIGDEFDLTVVVAPGVIECFYQPIIDPKHVTFEIDYQVVLFDYIF